MKRLERQQPREKVANPIKANLNDISFELSWHALHKSLEKWMGFLLFHVTELSGQFYSQALASIQLTPPHVGILQLLESDNGLVQARLSDYLPIDKASMVSLLNDLESQDLIERRPNPVDKRSYRIYLLKAGQVRLKEAERVNNYVNEQFFSCLSEDERTIFQDLLCRLATMNRSFKGEKDNA